MAGLIGLFTNTATASRRLGFGTVSHAPIVRGFSLIPEVTDALLVEVLDPSAPTTVITTLPQSKAREFMTAPSSVGAGSLQVLVTDSQVAQLTTERMLRWKRQGRPAEQTLIEVLSRSTVSEREEAGEILKVSGRSLVALFEEMVVFPSRGPAVLPIEDVRSFNFANVDFDDSGWGPATVIAYQTNQLFNWQGLPARWPAPNAGWIWAPGSTTTLAPSGTCYFRKWFLVPDGVLRITIYLALDDDGDLWFDGQKILSMVGFAEYRSVTIPVTPGLHLLAVKARNDPKYLTLLGGADAFDATYTIVSGDTLWEIAARFYGDPLRWVQIYEANKAFIDGEAVAHGKDPNYPGPGWWIFPGDTITLPGIPGPGGTPTYFNPAGVLCAVYEATADGIGTLLAVSESSWNCLPYPENEPGMTATEVLGILIAQAQARGWAPALNVTYTDTTDSAGRPMQQVADISVRVGDDGLTVLRQFADIYLDFALKPAGLTLDVFDIDTAAGAAVAAYNPATDPDDPTSGNITSLTHERTV